MILTDLPLQLELEHCWTWIESPLHEDPEHFLRLICCPVPHDRVQSPQAAHGSQILLLANYNVKMVKTINNKNTYDINECYKNQLVDVFQNIQHLIVFVCIVCNVFAIRLHMMLSMMSMIAMIPIVLVPVLWMMALVVVLEFHHFHCYHSIEISCSWLNLKLIEGMKIQNEQYRYLRLDHLEIKNPLGHNPLPHKMRLGQPQHH